MPIIRSQDPYTGEIYGEFETLTNEQLIEKIALADKAYQSWKKTSFSERKDLFYKLAQVIEADLQEYAKLQTQEM